MHFEILVEDSSGELLLCALLPKILGENGTSHTWRTHSYKGIGRLPRDLKGKTDPSKRILLDRLPKLLAGYGRSQQGSAKLGKPAPSPSPPMAFGRRLPDFQVSLIFFRSILD